MEKISKVPENIDRLLNSSVLEDILLGVLWCHRNLGIDWMRENFTYVPAFPSKDKQNFPTSMKQNTVREIFMRIGNEVVLIGPVCIELLDEGGRNRLKNHHRGYVYEED